MKPIIAANWKMHKLRHEVEEFFTALLPFAQSQKKGAIWIAPSATALHFAAENAKNSSIWIGAQNIYSEPQGPFTGEISALQVIDAGARFVIIGHSERRRYFRESHAEIKKKISIALSHQLTPLLCVGETLQERHNKKTIEVLRAQLSDVIDENFEGVVAYEPVWAIGTGLAATPEMIEEAHQECKKNLKNICKQGEQTPVLYGGSVSATLAPELCVIKNVDGALVGGASLEAESFISIIKGFTQ